MSTKPVCRALRFLLALLLASGMLASCGGGDAASGVDSGGTGVSPFLASGPIAGFGSVILNDVRFEDAAASVHDETGAAVPTDQLRLGMTARVEASDATTVNGQQTATAHAVSISSELVGPVERIDATLGVFRVLGQTVVVTPATVFDVTLAGGPSRLMLGTVVEIHGQYNAATQRYVATRVAPLASPAAYKIRGVVASVDPVGRTMVVGGLSIGYASLAANSVPNLAVGQFVRVRLALLPVAGVWTALSVVSGQAQIPDHPRARLIGRISSLTSTTSFAVDGVLVDASAVASAAANTGIVLGARVLVEGPIRLGVLNATIVAVKGDESLANISFELHGPIMTIDTVAQTLSVRGITVHYSGQVQFQAGVIGDLAVGRRIKVIGSLSTDATGLQAQVIAFE